ncbi:MAG: hypothetical protein Q8936_21815 [Bacillota bacterium]|nr:hypothetical protein [Bacillota bacterium]
MNKIKVLYDVVKTMKKKEIINGIMNLEVVNGETKVVSFSNEFTRNTVDGTLKAKISKEINMDGNKVKHETNADLNVKDCPFHKFHHGEHMRHGHKFSKALFMLNALNNLTAEEKGDKTILSLDLKEVLKEGKELKAEFHKHHQGCEGKQEFGAHKHHEFIKKFLCEEYETAILNVTVNKASEIENIQVSANGENIINGSVNFTW